MPHTKQSEIDSILSRRETKMYSYYKSVFQDNFTGGYPLEWDDEIKQALDTAYEKGKKDGAELGDLLCFSVEELKRKILVIFAEEINIARTEEAGKTSRLTSACNRVSDLLASLTNNEETK